MSRNSKSVWKLPYINPIFFNKNLLEKKNIKTVIRNTFLSSVLIGKTFLIFNGKKFDKILIKKEMKNFKLGEFSFTKIIGLNKGKKKGKKKK
jgi:ribosomal protein S19